MFAQLMPNFTPPSWLPCGRRSRLHILLLVLVIGALLPQARLVVVATSTPPGAATTETIPFAQLGQAVDQQNPAAAPNIQATATGAKLQAKFQALAGSLTANGLWLHSTAQDEAAGLPFRVMATQLGRNLSSMQPFVTKGVVQVAGEQARWLRAGIIEEYSVSTDGVRQDFVLLTRPAGTAQLRLDLAVNGATVSQSTSGDGLALRLAGSGRAGRPRDGSPRRDRRNMRRPKARSATVRQWRSCRSGTANLKPPATPVRPGRKLPPNGQRIKTAA